MENFAKHDEVGYRVKRITHNWCGKFKKLRRAASMAADFSYVTNPFVTIINTSSSVGSFSAKAMRPTSAVMS